MKNLLFAICTAVLIGVFPAAASTPASLSPPDPCSGYPYYDIGSPILRELYISPSGSDTSDGLSPASPLRTITAAWAKIPTGTLAGTGYRINFLPGTYPCEPGPEAENCQNYFADRRGTYACPIVLSATGGPGTAIVRGGLDIGNASYLYLIDLDLVGGNPLPTNASGNNLLHFASCDHILLRGLRVDGPNCDNDACNNLQEVLKVNQSQYFYVENCSISGAWHTVVDYMVVQYGHFLDNRLRTAGQWGMYAKGGTSYLLVAGNEFSNTLLGFGAGQSANLAMMEPPWLHYEVYDIKFVNNILHDLPGSGMSVSGGYNILLAYNTLYRVGASADNGYTLAQFVLGERNCTPTDDLPNPVPTCGSYLTEGGWGPNFQTESLPGISNRKVYVYNNIFYNPSPSLTMYTHLGVNGPQALQSGFLNAPNPAVTDDNLVFRGNVLWNGPASSLPLFGSSDGGETGCQGSNPTCNEAQFLTDNSVNSLEPQLVNPAGGDFHPRAGGNLFTVPAYAIPDFTWADAPAQPAVPQGNTSNAVIYDKAGNDRSSAAPPGAYATSADDCDLTCVAVVPLTGIAGIQVIFYSQSSSIPCTGKPTYSWDYGDGGTGIGNNTTHIYIAPGTYHWTLTTVVYGQTCIKSGSITISRQSCALTCEATVPLFANPGGCPVVFQCNVTATGCSGVTIYDWDFGDGSPHSSEQNPSHAYGVFLSCTWILTVSNGEVSCTKTGLITVLLDGCFPRCELTVEPSTGNAPLTVTFAAHFQPDDMCSSPPSFSWNFGDGLTGTDRIESHTYSWPGSYEWELVERYDETCQTCRRTGVITVMRDATRPGDCDGDGSVSIGEVQKAINMFLGLAPPDCGVDCDGNGQVSIGELQKVINSFLGLQGSC